MLIVNFGKYMYNMFKLCEHVNWKHLDLDNKQYR